MLKKISAVLLAAAMLMLMCSCGETKTLHCDKCNAEIEVDANSSFTEDDGIFCESCEAEIMEG